MDVQFLAKAFLLALSVACCWVCDKAKEETHTLFQEEEVTSAPESTPPPLVPQEEKEVHECPHCGGYRSEESKTQERVLERMRSRLNMYRMMLNEEKELNHIQLDFEDELEETIQLFPEEELELKQSLLDLLEEESKE